MTEPDPQLVDLAHQLDAAADADKPGIRDQMFDRYRALVRGGTTTDGLPYPDPDDPWFEGADAIRALAEALGGRTWALLTGTDRPNAAALPTAYPSRPAIMSLTDTEAAAGGWPGGGTWSLVLTYRIAGTSTTAQIVFHLANAEPATAYIRTGNSSGWGPWGNSGGPFGQAAGIVNVNHTTAGTTVTVTVTFPAGRFTLTPVPQVSAWGSPQPLSLAFGSPSPTSMNILLYRSTGTGTTSVAWQAVQMTSASAAGLAAALGDTVDATVTCPTDGCENQGVPIPVPTHWTDDDGVTHPVDEVVCGVCGTVLTPTTTEETP